MKRIIPITSTVKVRVKEILKNIFPKVGYVKVARSGIVTLKKRWFSIKRERFLITDLLMFNIPNRIADIAEQRGMGIGHKVIFNNALNAMFAMLDRNYTSTDILDYIWKQYNTYCNVHIPNISKTKIERGYGKTTPILSFISPRSIYGIDELLKQITKKTKSKDSEYLERIKRRLRFNHLRQQWFDILHVLSAKRLVA